MSIELNTLQLNVAVGTPAYRTRANRAESPTSSSTLPVEQSLWDRLAAVESEVLDNPTDLYITQYLDTVRDLLNQALKRHQAKSATYWSPKGRFRQMVHIVQVNRTLDDLLADIRLRHPATQMARRLDAIRGLLLDLWM